MPDISMMGQPRPDNQEAAMARADLYKLANYSMKLFKMIRDGQELEGWVQAKITKAADYIASVYHYMEYEMKFTEYGEKLETSDVYTENVKKQFIEKLTEARTKLEKLRQKNIADLSEGWEDMMKAGKDRREKEKKEQGTGKFDVKKTSTGTQYTRKASTFDDGGKDKDLKKAEKKDKKVKEAAAVPQDIDGASAPPAKGASKTITSGPDKGKQWGAKDPKTGKTAVGPTNPAVKEASHQAKTTMKHIKNPTAGEKQAAKDIKPGVAGYRDRIAMLKSAEKDGRLKEGSKPDFLDMDKDGNKKEPMKKAIADKKVKEATGGYSAKDARAGKDLGKPGKNFAKIAAKAGKEYGSKERGEKVAGAVLAKLRKG